MTERNIYLGHIRRLQEENDSLRRGLAAEYVRRVALHKALIQKEAEHQKWRKSRLAEIIDYLMCSMDLVIRSRR